ncbi:MAG: hypothetical protein IIC88_00410 [Chloroflexi bacterium]|nr:hypothetical protein [Chloroflexota bacterium]
MHHLRLNLRITMLAVAVAAVLLAGSLGQPPRQAEAAFTDVNGVICGYLHTLTGVPLPNFQGTTLARIDHDLGDDSVTVTAVAYTDPLGAFAMPDCKTAQAPMPTGATPPAANETRPSVIDLTYANNKISGGSCQADFAFGGITMPGGTIVSLQLDLSKSEPGVQSTGSFTFENIYTDGTCTTLSGTGLGTIAVQFDALYMAGPTIGTAVDSSNWDKDGGFPLIGSTHCSDWNELDPSPQANHSDPFKQGDCPRSVGGVAELAEAAGTPLDAPDSSGASTGLIAGVLAAIAAGVVALSGAAWYTKRRL